MADREIDQKLLDRLERLPLFSELSKPPFKKQREQLLQFHRFKTYPRGGTVVEQESFAGEFGVLISGVLGVFRLEPGEPAKRLATLAPGQWFGEMAALSNQPAGARVLAEEQSLILQLDGPLFKAFYEAAKGKSEFKRLIDEDYRQRSLANHLRMAPLFAGLGKTELDALSDAANLVMYDEGAVIAEEGTPADAVYLVRTGAVTRLNPEGSERRVHSYYRANSSFGDDALLPGEREWSGRYIASAPTHLVRLSRDVFEDALPGAEQGGTDAMIRLRAIAEEVVAEETGSSEEIGVMVRHESVKGGKALVIDLSKCTRCNACVESCVAVHEDGVPRLSKKGNRIEPRESGGPIRVLSSACYSCQIPDCMASCDYGAIRRDATGSIRFVFDNCVGCAKCPPACPYDVIRMTPPPEAPDSAPPSFLASLPLIGGLFRPAVDPPEEAGTSVAARTGTRVIAKAIKCDLCEGMPYEACVYNCPCGAIDREDPIDLFPERAAAHR